MSSWEAYLNENQKRYIDEVKAFLRFPSISSLPQHEGDVKLAADWVADRLKPADIENVQTLVTGGHPVVYGNWLHAPDEFFRLRSFHRSQKAYCMLLHELRERIATE